MKMGKRLILIIGLALVLGLSACGAQDDANTGEDLEQPQSQQETPSPEPVETPTPTAPDPHKVLVVYFSATGNTKQIAEHAAAELNADIFEIIPQEPYSEADLNYNDPESRTSIEQNDDIVRPAISGTIENMEEYGTVFLAYPLWFGEAPRIMRTFVESYDFSDKTVVPFCTSGSSSIGSSASALADLCPDSTNWVQGQRFSSGTSQQAIAEWINELDLNLSAD